MKVPTPHYRCPLGRLQPEQADPERLKRQGWCEQGLLVLSAQDERLDWMERELIRQIGERLYGKREMPHAPLER